MTKERRLGRGLEALLGRPASLVAEPDAGRDGGRDDAPHREGLVQLNVYEVERNPHQPRQEFDEGAIRELAASIREHGLIQPIVVRRVGDRYQLVAGERRLRAAIQAGWQSVPAQIREADDRQMAELAIVENLHRKDLNPLEKAASFQEYLRSYRCTQEELAGRLQLDRSTIANLIRLLELPQPVQESLRRGAITQGHARALLPLGDEREQIAVCKRIEEESLTVRQVEALVQNSIHHSDSEPLSLFPADAAPQRAAKPRSENTVQLEQQLRSALGAKVEIRQTARGRGRIVVHFKNADEFARLQQFLCGRGRVEHHSQAG